MLTIEKVLNVNVVLAADAEKKELLLMGRGIGFAKKKGDAADEDKIERVFRPERTDEKEKLLHLLSAIPMEYFDITQEVVRYAHEKFGFDIGKNIFIVLPDHIHFAVERFKSEVSVASRISFEIRSFYPEEYAVGAYALSVVAQKTGIELPEDEAANIAFHIINQRRDCGNSHFEAMHAAKMISAVMSIIKYSLNAKIDAQGPNYSRFVTHMQYFAERFYSDSLLCGDEFLYEYIASKLGSGIIMDTVGRIDRYFKKEYNRALPHEELAYFAMHLDRISKEEQNGSDINKEIIERND